MTDTDPNETHVEQVLPELRKSARDQTAEIMAIYRTLSPEHQADTRKLVSVLTAIEEREKLAQSREA